MCTDIVISIKNRQQMYKLIRHYQEKIQKVWVLCNEHDIWRIQNTWRNNICHI